MFFQNASSLKTFSSKLIKIILILAKWMNGSNIWVSHRETNLFYSDTANAYYEVNEDSGWTSYVLKRSNQQVCEVCRNDREN